MKMVGTFEGKTHFYALVEAAARGETTVITRKGIPVAKIVPIKQPSEHSPREALDRILARRVRIGIPVRELVNEGRDW